MTKPTVIAPIKVNGLTHFTIMIFKDEPRLNGVHIHPSRFANSISRNSIASHIRWMDFAYMYLYARWTLDDYLNTPDVMPPEEAEGVIYSIDLHRFFVEDALSDLADCEFLKEIEMAADRLFPDQDEAAIQEIERLSSIISEAERKNTGFIYLFYSPLMGYYKIGKSISPENRASGISVTVDVIHTIRTSKKHMHSHEQGLHNRYDHARVDKEWFALTDEDVADICAIEELQ